jgi:hypothetical protein
MGNQPIVRPLPTLRTTQTQNKRTQTSMPRVGFEHKIPVFGRADISCLRPRGHCDWFHCNYVLVLKIRICFQLNLKINGNLLNYNSAIKKSPFEVKTTSNQPVVYGSIVF